MSTMRRSTSTPSARSTMKRAACRPIAAPSMRTVVSAGMASPESTLPMQRHTLFDLASISKVVGTTTALHRLASLRLLGIDSPVKFFLPGFAGAEETTVRDLLQHRGGLWEWQPIYLAPGGQDDPHRVVEELPLRHAPGTSRHYSDLGFMMLGRVVEKVTGYTLDVAVQKLVAEPLGLEQLSYGPVTGDVATSALGDRTEQAMVASGDPFPVLWSDNGFPWREIPIRGSVNDCNAAHAFNGVSGHAGMFSTIDELLNVGMALGSAQNNSALWDPAVTDDFFAAGPDPEQALGWRRQEIVVNGTSQPLLWHPGFTGTAMGFIPDANTAVAFASNRLLADQPQPTAALWNEVLAALRPIVNPQE